MRKTSRKTAIVLALCIFLLVNCKADQPQVVGESAYHPRSDTWLEILGAPENLAGTSVVEVLDDNYVVAAGFTPGLESDFALIGMSTDGIVEAKRFTSDRVHTGGMGLDFLGNTLFVKAITQGGNKLSLVFDNIWMPDVENQDRFPGWQIVIGDGSETGVALTDVIKFGSDFFLRAAVGNAQTAHLAIMRVNPGGTIKWTVEYPDVRVDRDGKMFLTGDGRLITAGYVRGEDKAESAVILWLNSDGSLIRTVSVKMQPFQLHPDAPYAQSYGYQDLALLPDGDLILVQNFQICSIECVGSGALITRLASNGEHVWTVGLHAKLIGGETFISEIHQEGDALLLVGGSSIFLEPTAYSHLNIFMASLSASSGQPNWIRSIGPERYTWSTNEFKTDVAYAMLPTGDGRMIITGTTDSFGSGQVWTSGPYYDHYDLFLGVAGTEFGAIRGASSIMWTPDLGDEYDVWDEEKQVDLGGCEECTSQICENVSMIPVEYTVDEQTLESRDLSSGFDPARQGLTFKFDDKGRHVISSRSFTDPETDLDEDSLDQNWENAALEAIKPIVELEEDESWLEHQSDHHVVHFVRVTPYPSKEDPVYILFEYAITWGMDYGAVVIDPTFLTDALIFEDHRGDIEKVYMAWRIENERSMQLEWVYTSAHFGSTLHEGVWNAYDPTCNRGNISDTGKQPGQEEPEKVGSELMCGALQFKGNRLLVQVSQDKHAIYPTKDICNEHVNLVAALGNAVWGEACGGGGEFSFDAYNVGEPGHHLIDMLATDDDWEGLTEEQVASLTGLFPNESIYSGNLFHPDWFCGGVMAPPDSCAKGTVGKSLDDDLPDILVDKLGPTTYRVAIRTGNTRFAGTDSAITITLYGEDGETYIQELDGSFEKNSEDVFHIGNPLGGYVGDILRIGLQKNDDETNPDRYIDLYGYFNLESFNPTSDWFVQEVGVENKVTGETWIFNISEEITDSAEHIYLPQPAE